MPAVTVELPPATEQRLRDQAAAAGLSAGDYPAALADQSLADAPVGAVARLTGRAPEQVAADRAAVLATACRGRPLSAGQMLVAVVEGICPVDEPDVVVRQAHHQPSDAN